MEPWLDHGPGHPSWLIRGEKGETLRDRCIALGVTGSAAVYRGLDLARALMRLGAVVRVVMTPAAAELVSPALFEWATGLPVVSRLTGLIEHVSLARRCDAVVVAPATLESLHEAATGGAGDPVSALVQEAMGLGRTVLFIPAMHEGMWRRAERLVEELERQGAAVYRPRLETGQAKFPDPWLAAWWVEARVLRGGDLAGLVVAATAGPTRERIDAVRVITNPSSGLMGVSIALEAAMRGARVRLVHGPLCCCPWQGWSLLLEEERSVETTEEMLEATLEAVRGADMAFYAAAPADYRPASPAEGKIPSARGGLELRLEPTPKIVEAAVQAEPRGLHVGFAAEPLEGEELLARAREKMERYGLDAVAANPVAPGLAFASPRNRVYLLDWRGRVQLLEGDKRLVARMLLDHAASMLERGEKRPR